MSRFFTHKFGRKAAGGEAIVIYSISPCKIWFQCFVLEIERACGVFLLQCQSVTEYHFSVSSLILIRACGIFLPQFSPPNGLVDRCKYHYERAEVDDPWVLSVCFLTLPFEWLSTPARAVCVSRYRLYQQHARRIHHALFSPRPTLSIAPIWLACRKLSV